MAVDLYASSAKYASPFTHFAGSVADSLYKFHRASLFIIVRQMAPQLSGIGAETMETDVIAAIYFLPRDAMLKSDTWWQQC